MRSRPSPRRSSHERPRPCRRRRGVQPAPPGHRASGGRTEPGSGGTVPRGRRIPPFSVYRVGATSTSAVSRASRAPRYTGLGRSRTPRRRRAAPRTHRRSTRRVRDRPSRWRRTGSRSMTEPTVRRPTETKRASDGVDSPAWGDRRRPTGAIGGSPFDRGPSGSEPLRDTVRRFGRLLLPFLEESDDAIGRRWIRRALHGNRSPETVRGPVRKTHSR